MGGGDEDGGKSNDGDGEGGLGVDSGLPDCGVAAQMRL